MENLQTKLENTRYFIKQKTNISPKIGIILGSGLSNTAKKIDVDAEFSYSSLPNFLPSKVEGHIGQLLLGRYKQNEIAVLNGRNHYYEGYSFDEICYPVRLLKMLGVEYLLITSAVGSMKKNIKKGDLVIIKDHINFMGENVLRSSFEEESIIKFLDLTDCYDNDLNAKAKSLAKIKNISVKEGTYFAVSGPTYETPAEVKAFSKLGGDVIGMSVVPEAVIAKKLNIKVCAISYVSNYAAGLQNTAITHSEVLKNAQNAAGKISDIIFGLVDCIYPVRNSRTLIKSDE
ncbi:MAG: purine-nucleoside phosphorylase [Elusimicrobia bacterium]|nr:purine-nucleoside phosphorylase [Elusimicrobiota bacterium]